MPSLCRRDRRRIGGGAGTRRRSELLRRGRRPLRLTRPGRSQPAAAKRPHAPAARRRRRWRRTGCRDPGSGAPATRRQSGSRSDGRWGGCGPWRRRSLRSPPGATADPGGPSTPAGRRGRRRCRQLRQPRQPRRRRRWPQSRPARPSSRPARARRSPAARAPSSPGYGQSRSPETSWQSRGCRAAGSASPPPRHAPRRRSAHSARGRIVSREDDRGTTPE